MPGFLLTMQAVVTCAHGGKATPTTPNPRLKIAGSPVPMSSAPVMIAGCPNVIPPPAGPGPTPCISGTFLTMTQRVKSMGQGLLCQTSMSGPCMTTPPASPMPLIIISAGQVRVKAL
ncbi:MAG: hypothetical protein ACRD6I_12385 [Candidatus Acidiferrales bacterium]